MTNISHIVVNGCSFTYGDELSIPQIYAWPAIVSKNLNLPIVNLARGGIGNDAIHRRTYEYFYEDLHNNNNPLYIIGFSLCSRKEYWNDKYKHYEGLHLKNMSVDDMNYAQLDFLENYSMEDLYRKTLLYKASLKNLFISHNVPYLFLNMLTLENEDTEGYKLCLPKVGGMFEYTKKDNITILGTIYEQLIEPTYCSFGHYDIKTNEQIGNIITKHLKNIYNIDIIKPKPFLSLSEYTERFESFYIGGEMTTHYGAWM